MKKELLQQFQIHSNLVHKIQVYVLFSLFYHVTALYTRTAPADDPAGTETVLRNLAIRDGLFLLPIHLNMNITSLIL